MIAHTEYFYPMNIKVGGLRRKTTNKNYGDILFLRSCSAIANERDMLWNAPDDDGEVDDDQHQDLENHSVLANQRLCCGSLKDEALA